MDRKDLTQFESAIGKLAMTWALAELGLDKCVSSLFTTHGGSTLRPKIPLNAGDKIRFFRQAVQKASHLTHAGEYAAEIADEMHIVLADRNWCIHGTALQMMEPEFGAATIVLTRQERPNLKGVEKKEVSLKDIERASFRCIRLSVAFGLFLWKPLGVLPKDTIHNAFRRLGIEVPDNWE
ncbi:MULTISPECIES: hypothetical protein [unclassified Mesorhizobium]|uniref:hypothetical protein n=1 Tax=unclassified Mesorhizobium TaxID=325217 RepID=UPI003335747B